MGFCIACFLRDTAGALRLQRSEAVQYIRPEIIGLVLGAFLMAFGKKEFKAKCECEVPVTMGVFYNKSQGNNPWLLY